jgi:hypothetical protein
MAEPTIYRFLRVLEYVGTEERLREARERRQVKGTQAFGPGLKIYEGLVGDADQPVIGQIKLWAMQQIVGADEGRLYPDDDSMRDGYLSAIQDLLELITPPATKEPSNG